MGTQEPPKWAFPATMETPETWDPQSSGSPPPTWARCALPMRPLSGEDYEPRYCHQVKSIQEKTHPTETTQAFYQL